MLNRSAQRAQLRATVNAAEKRVRSLHACRDWLGMPEALQEYWRAAAAWRSV